MKKFRLAIFASGSGSNAETICKYFKSHEQIEIVLILTNNPQAGVLERAKVFSIETIVFTKADFQENQRVQQLLQDHAITHIVLAGFLWIVPKYLIHLFPARIVNIHPALLPKFGGKGMYGIYVHEAVKQAGEVQSGITIHIVDENFDEGKQLAQVACAIEPHDSPQTIAKKVQQLEHIHYPTAIEHWVLSTHGE